MSKAYRSNDKERIFDAVKSSVDFATVNRMVVGKMREWAIAAIDETIDEENVSQLLVWDMQVAKMSLLIDMEIYSDALKIGQKCERKFYYLEKGWDREGRWGKTYNNLGRVYSIKGDYPNALEYYEKCLAIQLKTLGAEHPSVATSYNNLGTVYSKQGDYPKALQYYEKCLAMRLKFFGKKHPKTRKAQKSIDLIPAF